ncbi:IclR family transcriptional regulator [Acidimangrovimonas sediminis]|uniref:IclR family transcriptional regulator n=1 Tax=Acidimangrovimonas sediminis TaxID=2056283 RepID=UPI001304A46A|nr:IclR family transcriptional regulator [Acidimangrovimonas sediminis]
MSAAERALSVLTLFINSDGALTAQQVAASMAMPLATAYRHLGLLKRMGFVTDLGRDGGFALGPAAFRMAERVGQTSYLSSVAVPEMQRLSRETEESVGLMRLVGGQIQCLEMVESAQPLRCSFVKGGLNTLNRGATAQAILAFMDAGLRGRILRQLGQPGLLSAEEILAVQATGHAESEGEVDAGVWGVSAPIYSAPGRFEGCVTLMAPAVRVADRRAGLIASLAAHARNITDQLSSTTNQQETL